MINIVTKLCRMRPHLVPPFLQEQHQSYIPILPYLFGRLLGWGDRAQPNPQFSMCRRCQATYFPKRRPHQIFLFGLLPVYHAYFQHRIKKLALLTLLAPYLRRLFLVKEIDCALIVLLYVVCNNFEVLRLLLRSVSPP